MKRTDTNLMEYTRDRCHEIFRSYIPDPMMTYDPYEYDNKKTDRYFDTKVQETNRLYFAIVVDGNTVGEIQLKRIDFEQGHGTLSIVIVNDKYKNKGYGSEAIRQLIEIAKERLGIKTIYADAIHRNIRSQHVLEKIGFEYLKSDDDLRYYSYVIEE